MKFYLFNLTLSLTLILSLSCSQHIQMEPIQFKAQKQNGKMAVEVMDPEILFREGSEAFDKENYAEALRKFRLIIKEFPKTNYTQPAFFNSGLALQELEKYEEALGTFDRYIAMAQENNKYRRDALSHSVECLEKLEKWEELLKRLSELEQNRDLSLGEKIFIFTIKGKTLRMLKKYFEAEKALNIVKDLYKNESDNPVLEGNYFISMAFYETGEIYRDLFSSIKLTLPMERMEKDLLDKSNLFIKAQNNYLHAIRIHNIEWAISSGFKIGKLYEDFYHDFLRAEVPSGLTEEEIKVYFIELKKKIKPLILRAIEVYERNLSLAKRTEKGEKCLIEMENRLNKLRDFLKNNKF